MANSNDNAIVRVERDGVEYFTIKATGRSGLSGTGMARSLGVSKESISALAAKVQKSVSGSDLPESLKPLLGQDIQCQAKWKNIKIYTSECWACFADYFAHDAKKTTKQALATYRLFGRKGSESYIQTQTGWLPEQYTAAPAAHKQLSRILDTPNPWSKLYETDFCRQVFKWYGPQFYWIFCYCFLTPVERCKLDQINPAIKGSRKHKIHQYLEEDTKQRLAPHVWQLIAIVNTAGDDKQLFLTGYQRHFEGITQLTLV